MVSESLKLTFNLLVSVQVDFLTSQFISCLFEATKQK